MTGSLIIGYNISPYDEPTLVVSEKEPNDTINVLNAFSGPEAVLLYAKLVADRNGVVHV